MSMTIARLLITLGGLFLAAWAYIGFSIAAFLVTGVCRAGFLCIPNISNKLLFTMIALFVLGLTSIYWGRAIVDQANWERACEAIRKGRDGRIRIG